MRRVIQLIFTVFTISISAFLIHSSCHEDPGDYDPKKKGGISQAIRPAERESITVSTAPTFMPELKENADMQQSQLAPRHQSPAVSAAKKEPPTVAGEAERIATPRAYALAPEAGGPADNARATTSAANTDAAANEKLQGNWMLSDGDTTMQLIVVNDTGMLRAQISEAGRSVIVEQRVQLLTDNNTIYVYGSVPTVARIVPRLRADPHDRPIVLAFNFGADGSPQVVWRQGEAGQFRRLNVLSHSR